MLMLEQIEQAYPKELRKFRRFILREYLQHKILQIIFESDHARELIFLGGTCLRIVHGNNRFSEDIDFDNFNISEPSFESIAKTIEKELKLEGYTVEMKTVYKGAYHCHIKFPKILFDEGLSGYEEEKILIQLDTEPQHYNFEPEKFLLNRFDVFTEIFITPLPLLLAQKFYAILNRPRNKGRDFFDISFLLSKITAPDYGYLNMKLGIRTPEELKKRLIDKCATINMTEMAKDVSPFLFDPKEEKKVLFFEQLIQQSSLK